MTDEAFCAGSIIDATRASLVDEMNCDARGCAATVDGNLCVKEARVCALGNKLGEMKEACSATR